MPMPKRLRLLEKTARALWLCTLCSVVGVVILFSTMTAAQTLMPNIARLDRLAQRARSLEAAPGFARARLYGVARNLTAFADRWQALRARLATPGAGALENDGELAGDAAFAEVGIGAFSPISTPTLDLSRYAGFTQSQTSTAWCGQNVITMFNDTGSEARTMAAQSGITAVGFANSSNSGHAFAYRGAPPGGTNFDQTVLGSPTVACAEQSNFFYAAIWIDTLNNVTGVAFARSSDAGHTFATPIVAASKSASTDFVDHSWLAIDSNRATIYIAYADLDYSGSFCGTDPDTGSTIPRYAIELVTSTDAGVIWTAAPAVIEQVCANAANPWVAVMGPQVAIGPAGQVYVAYEAAGANGGGPGSRQIKIARSDNSGVTFAPGVIVAAVTPVGDGADLQGFVRANEFPSLAIGKGKKDLGFIYLAWNDGSNAVPDTMTTTGSYTFADIKFSVSQDGGENWKAPTIVNNNAKGGVAPLTDQFEPAVAADKNGTVAVCFYDRRRDANNFKIDRECGKSKNGGSSWTNKRVTANNFPTEVGQDLLVAPDYMGDFDAVAADSTNQTAGFIDSYADNSAGHPNVMTDRP
jgi:hypothetical protein